MSISLQVEISVKSVDPAQPPPPTTPDPTVLYDSTSAITADTSSSISITVPAKQKGWEVYVEAGQREWLKFFAISPTKKEHPFPKGFAFQCADDKTTNPTKFKLEVPVAYWGDALCPLFEELDELDKILFINPTACSIDLTIYFARDVAQKPAVDPCPQYPGQQQGQGY
jgi:hypothetical protein